VATKYVRKSYQNPSDADQNRYTRKSLLSSADPKRRLLYIYLGIGVFAAGLYVFHFTGLNNELGWKPAVEGPGVVIALILEGEPPDTPRYYADIAVDVPPGVGDDPPARQLVARVEIAEENFDSVKQGTVLTVRYQTAYSGDKIRIKEVFLTNPVAPSGKNTEEAPGVAPDPEFQ